MSRIPKRGLGAFAFLGIASVMALPVRAQSHPAPQPAPAQQQQQTEEQKAAAAKRARAQEQQKEQERIAKERAEKERAEKERAEKAHETGKPAPAAGAKPAPANAATPEEQRAIAKKAAHFEHNYRLRMARIDRLIRIYKAKGDTAKVTKLEQWKTQQEKRRANAMEGFRKQLSSDNWGKLNSEMQKQHGRGENPTTRAKAKDAEKARPSGG